VPAQQLDLLVLEFQQAAQADVFRLQVLDELAGGCGSESITIILAADTYT
jgi:hypothetical protein